LTSIMTSVPSPTSPKTASSASAIGSKTSPSVPAWIQDEVDERLAGHTMTPASP